MELLRVGGASRVQKLPRFPFWTITRLPSDDDDDEDDEEKAAAAAAADNPRLLHDSTARGGKHSGGAGLEFENASPFAPLTAALSNLHLRKCVSAPPRTHGRPFE